MLPHPATDEEFHALDPQIDYAPALRLIAERVGLVLTDVEPSRFADGSLPVFAVGKRVVKLYPPSCRSSWNNEQRVLVHVGRGIGIPTPELIASGELDEWGYAVMSRIEGDPLRVRFDDIPESQRVRLARKLGEAVARLHALDIGGLPRPDWTELLRAQRAGCLSRHASRGLAAVWLERIEPFLDEWLPRLPITPLHLLHTEIMREHVFVRRTGDRWELSGLLDFEPSRVGPAEYELSSVGLFFSEGDRRLWGSFLQGFGKTPDDELAQRCMAWGLLHRYANLSWWLERSTPRSRRSSLSDLANEWFR